MVQADLIPKRVNLYILIRGMQCFIQNFYWPTGHDKEVVWLESGDDRDVKAFQSLHNGNHSSPFEY